MVTKVASDRQGIQSIEVGFRLLDVLVDRFINPFTIY